MSLLPDTDEMYAVADRINGHATAARERASRLSGAIGGTGWSGVAADAFEGMALVVLNALRTSADRLDSAADALRRHASNVDHAASFLTTIEAGAGGLVSDAVDTVESIGSLVGI